MKKISVKNLEGTVEQVDLVHAFKINDINKRFVILSKGEVVSEGMSKIYISEFTEDVPGTFSLIGITDDTVWDKVKQAMKQIVDNVDKTTLSSEVENILTGVVERKANADKAIGVSTANLEPDVNGEVPLSKQSAFMIVPAPTPEVVPAEETPVLVNPVAEATQMENTPVETAPAEAVPVQPTAAPVEPTAAAPEVSAPEAQVMPEAPAPVTPVDPALDSLAPVEPTVPTEGPVPAETIPASDPALDSLAPAETVTDNLGPTPYTEPIAEVSLETPMEEAPVENTVEEIPVPQDDVITEAPIDVADTSALEGFDVKGMIPDINIPEPATEPVEEAKEEIEMPEMPEVLAQEPTETNANLFADETPILPEQPVEEVPSPTVGEAIDNPLANEEPVETLGEETVTMDNVETSPEIFDETSTSQETNKPSIFEGDYKSEKLDEIIAKLDSIDETLRELNEKLDTKSFQEPTMEAMSAPTMDNVIGFVPEPVVEPVAEPVADSIPEPVVDTPAVVEQDIPMVGGVDPIPEQPMGDPALIPQQNDGEMVDALSQLPNVLDGAIDETPIQGGMFI